MKDYKALSLSYQPCNRPIQTEPEPARKKRKSKGRPSKRLRKFAANLREKMTPSEVILDSALAEVLPRYSLKHESQFVVGKFIADFSIPARHLIIEVDGIYHFFQGRKDGFRTKKIKAHGWRVIRFTNHDVESNIEGVVNEILAACGSQYEVTTR